jgi:hypothetical protein
MHFQYPLFRSLYKNTQESREIQYCLLKYENPAGNKITGGTPRGFLGYSGCVIFFFRLAYSARASVRFITAFAARRAAAASPPSLFCSCGCAAVRQTVLMSDWTWIGAAVVVATRSTRHHRLAARLAVVGSRSGAAAAQGPYSDQTVFPCLQKCRAPFSPIRLN